MGPVIWGTVAHEPPLPLLETHASAAVVDWLSAPFESGLKTAIEFDAPT